MVNHRFHASTQLDITEIIPSICHGRNLIHRFVPRTKRKKIKSHFEIKRVSVTSKSNAKCEWFAASELKTGWWFDCFQFKPEKKIPENVSETPMMNCPVDNPRQRLSNHIKTQIEAQSTRLSNWIPHSLSSTDWWDLSIYSFISSVYNAGTRAATVRK